MLLAHVNQLWYALPLVVTISLVYSATRHEEMSSILWHALRLGTWIGVFLVGLGLFLWWLGRGL
jgi:hypothetical protein